MPKAEKNDVRNERPTTFEHFDTAIPSLGQPKVDTPIKSAPLFNRDGKFVETSAVLGIFDTIPIYLITEEIYVEYTP